MQQVTPLSKIPADNFAMSDITRPSWEDRQSRHASVRACHWFTASSEGNRRTPAQFLVRRHERRRGRRNRNPNPQASSSWYTEDGYGGGSFGSPSFGGGTYTNCSDLSQPGVEEITSYLGALSTPISPNCAPGHFYLLNNYNPGYYGDGRNAYADIGNPAETVFTIPPSPLRNIGDKLIQKGISGPISATSGAPLPNQ
jgi:phospholipase C